jgi:hypothetical protein
MIDNVVILDPSSLSAEILSGIQSGRYKIYNGVVRNIADKHQIVAHIPSKMMQFNPNELQNLPKLMKKAQNMMVASVALSTLVIVGAIVVATTMIIDKLKQIENKLDDIQKELQDQNFFQYFLQYKNYIATCESLRELLQSPECIGENRDIIVMKLNQLSIERNALMLVIHERIRAINTVSTKHKQLIIDFLNQSVMLLPKLVYIEREASYKIDRFYLGDTIEHEFNKKYQHIEYQYKRYLDDERKKSLKNESSLSITMVNSMIESAKQEFEINQYLLAA